MSDPTDTDKLANHETRLLKLENNIDKNHTETMVILRKIEDRSEKVSSRLVGDIDSREPGLINEVVSLTRDFSELKNHSANIISEIGFIKQTLSNTSRLEKEVDDLKKKMEKVIKFQFYAAGGLLVLVFVINTFRFWLPFFQNKP